MTANQINYWNLQETGRHNRVTEAETERHNRRTEDIDLAKLSETTRHNMATEDISNRTLSETTRHNLAQESYNVNNLAETQRHNVATESIGQYDVNIKQQQVEEQERHNTVAEALEQISNKAKVIQARAEADYKETMGYWKDLEGASSVALSEAQRVQISHLIDKIDGEIARAKRQNTVDSWNAVNNSVQAFAKIVDALIPG